MKNAEKFYYPLTLALPVRERGKTSSATCQLL